MGVKDWDRIKELTSELEDLGQFNATEVSEWAMKYLKSICEDYGKDGERALELLSTVSKLIDL